MPTLDETLTDVWTKQPPNALDAEVALLSSLMRATDEPAVIAAARSKLQPRDFYQPDHGIIFESICRLFDADKPVELHIIAADLGERGLLLEIGGTEHLGRIYGS